MLSRFLFSQPGPSEWTNRHTSVNAYNHPDPTDAAYVGGFEGARDTNWGMMTCSVIGTSVHCEYTWDQGRIDAVLSADGRTMDGQWTESPSYALPDDGG